jgi:methylenetetrahydrofolate--tRNA-(uracil-5-)-methyltransferase
MLASRIRQEALPAFPETSALGALIHKITSSEEIPFSPVCLNFSLFPPFDQTHKKVAKAEKKQAICDRALQDLSLWISKVSQDTKLP